MNADEFFNKLFIDSTGNHVIDKSIHPIEHSIMSSSFNIVIKENPLPNDITDKNLNDLFKKYNASCFEIGMFRFLDNPIFKGSFWHIGYFETDPVIFDFRGVTVRDSNKLNHIMYNCSYDGASLLSCLSESSSYLNMLMVNDIGNSKAEEDFLKKVVALSGVKDSISFYSTLLGVF